MKVNKNEVVPADILILKTSLENGFCYLQTSNLDGESALKAREALIKTHSMIDLRRLEDSILKLKGYIEIDKPNEDIHFVEGTIYLDDKEKSSFNINNILLRGGQLKNVDYVIGFVVYTGVDTKIMKNIQKGSVKLSHIEHQLNKIVILIIIIVFGICVFGTVSGIVFYVKGV